MSNGNETTNQNQEAGAGAATAPGEQRAQAQPVVRTGPVEEIYVDGLAGLFGRGGVVKLDLFRVVGVEAESNRERRQLSHRLVVPLTAIPDFIRAFQTLARAARERAGAQGGGEQAGAEDVTIRGDEDGDIRTP